LRRAALVGLLVALVTAVPAAAQSPTPRASLPDIEDEVMCIVCGVPLELATEAPQAIQERNLIRHLIAQGLTKEEIKDRLVAEYGPNVLATPDDSGFDLAAWLVPGAGIVVAAIAIAIGLRRWRRRGGDGDSAEPPDGDGTISDSDAKRLDEDLARYRL
jgi:cytochrome c-type biogenesis protein CcmH